MVVPARGAAATLGAAIRSALDQEGTRVQEVLVAVDPDDVETRAAAADVQRVDRRVHVVDNPAGTTPAGLNRAIAESTGSVIVRLDAHAILPSEYIATALDVLRETGAGNVGGRQVPRAEGGLAHVIATAMLSPLGTGGATYRSGRVAGPADTVYLGVYCRRALEAVGGFDERLLRNQDYELNHRLRQAGWLVWFDPRLAVAYHPRGSLRALARQYGDYGRFKRLMLRENPTSLRFRQAAPLLMVVSHVAAVVVGAAVGAWCLPAIVAGAYVGVLLAGGLAADPRRAVLVAAALATMHWAWAIGFLVGLPARTRSAGAAGTKPPDADPNGS